MRKLVIIGAGGFGQEAVWVAESMNSILPPDDRWEILGYLDDDDSSLGKESYGFKVLGKPSAFNPAGREVWFHCAIGNNIKRERVAQSLSARHLRSATLIHPSVIIARDVSVGGGSFVGAGSILSPNCCVGRYVLINQRVSIGHDASLDDFSQACPGAQINGFAKVCRGALIGSNASIHFQKTVGEHAVVGSNSQVIRNVAPRTTVSGVPATVLMRSQ